MSEITKKNALFTKLLPLKRPSEQPGGVEASRTRDGEEENDAAAGGDGGGGGEDGDCVNEEEDDKEALQTIGSISSFTIRANKEFKECFLFVLNSEEFINKHAALSVGGQVTRAPLNSMIAKDAMLEAGKIIHLRKRQYLVAATMCGEKEKSLSFIEAFRSTGYEFSVDVALQLELNNEANSVILFEYELDSLRQVYHSIAQSQCEIKLYGMFNVKDVAVEVKGLINSDGGAGGGGEEKNITENVTVYYPNAKLNCNALLPASLKTQRGNGKYTKSARYALFQRIKNVASLNGGGGSRLGALTDKLRHSALRVELRLVGTEEAVRFFCFVLVSFFLICVNIFIVD